MSMRQSATSGKNANIDSRFIPFMFCKAMMLASVRTTRNVTGITILSANAQPGCRGLTDQSCEIGGQNQTGRPNKCPEQDCRVASHGVAVQERAVQGFKLLVIDEHILSFFVVSYNCHIIPHDIKSNWFG